ncbi:MAG: type 4a pilus biogenesis protein PilO [Deltaproteobacteria bacterium]|nr:type 4a pilus biogenesis protein PilO [Deltaproteobacteria bacterium]
MDPFSSITDRLSQWPLSQKILLALVGLAVLGTLLGYYLLMPRWKESKALQQDINREKIKLAQIIRTRAQIIQFKQELAEIDNRYRQIVIMLPEAKEIPHLLKNISNMGLQQGLEFLLFKPEKENPKEFVAEIPITLHLKGSYHQTGIFFDHIRRLPRIVNIKRLELGGFEEKNAKISIRCQLVTFRVLPLPPPSSSSKPMAGKK